MSQHFSFSFSSDDIDADDEQTKVSAREPASLGQEDPKVGEPPLIPATKHDVEELLNSLPSKIAYSILEIQSPKGKKISIPRRELFDIRMQLMAEDVSDDFSALSGIDDIDIKTNIYEGGFKVWECSVDLAKLLIDRGPRKDIDDLYRVNQVIELGCGAALPTLILFNYALTHSLSLYFTLADYNSSVLRLVTLPNLLLSYAKTLPSTSPPFSPDSPNPLATEPSGDLEISPALITSFLSFLHATNIQLTLLSGSWTPSENFLSVVPSSQDMNTLVLASETIYSPSALEAFTEVLVGILERVRMGKGMVAAKRMYVGVGGSVNEFKEECAKRKAVVGEIHNTEEYVTGGSGIRRALLEVQML